MTSRSSGNEGPFTSLEAFGSEKCSERVDSNGWSEGDLGGLISDNGEHSSSKRGKLQVLRVLQVRLAPELLHPQ